MSAPTKASSQSPSAPAEVIYLAASRWPEQTLGHGHRLRALARRRRVFYVEPPVFHDGEPRLAVRREHDRWYVGVAYLPRDGSAQDAMATLQSLLIDMVRVYGVESFVAWCDLPGAGTLAELLHPRLCVYDVYERSAPCMS